MAHAKLAVSIPEDTWIHELSVDYPDVTVRVVAVTSREDAGVVLLELRTPDLVSPVAAVEQRTDVSQCDLLWTQADTTMLQVETTDPRLLEPVLAAGVPLRTPFEISDGVATWELTTSRARLSALGDRLEDADVAFDLEFLRGEGANRVETRLTDRQREVLVAAIEQGYYETPRRTTLTDVSASLGISKATGSEVLHRAEGAILTWFVDEFLRSGGQRV